MKANERQEGGDHYGPGKELQHWDLSRIFQWDPFQYQITKYVMRWKDKHSTTEKKLEDLKKARHFLDKYIEDFESWLRTKSAPTEATARDLTPAEIARIAAEIVSLGGGVIPHAFKIQPADSDDDFKCEGWWGDHTQLYKCRRCSTYLRATSLSNALDEHGECPGRAYVAQG